MQDERAMQDEHTIQHGHIYSTGLFYHISLSATTSFFPVFQYTVTFPLPEIAHSASLV